MIRLGASCDWTREHFTLEPALYRAVLEAFLRLYREGLIYRGRYMVNWCPRCQTAISDLEVVHKSAPGKLWHIRYPIVGLEGIISSSPPRARKRCSATRPSPCIRTMSAISALVGKNVMLPLMNREIPIIADAYVDREFGTGAVKITPAHDPNDFEVGKRHNLPEIDVMTDDAHMSEAAGKYAGPRPLRRARANRRRPARSWACSKASKEHTHAVGVCDRCKSDSRAAHLDAVVLQDEAARRAREGSRAATDLIEVVPDNQRTILLQLARKYSRLVHLAPALVGPPHSDLALRRLQGNGSGARFARRNCRRPRARRQRARQMPEVRRREAHAGYRRARHLVQLRPVAVFHARLARRHRRPAHVLPHQPADQRLRHSVLLGRAHDHDGPAPDGRAPSASGSRFPSAGFICIRWCAPPKARRCRRPRARASIRSN